MDWLIALMALSALGSSFANYALGSKQVEAAKARARSQEKALGMLSDRMAREWAKKWDLLSEQLQWQRALAEQARGDAFLKAILASQTAQAGMAANVAQAMLGGAGVAQGPLPSMVANIRNLTAALR